MYIDMQGELKPWQINPEKEQPKPSRERSVIIVRNRDIPLLADVLPIMQEIKQIEQRRNWQRDRMENITQHISGTPGGGGVPKGLDEAFALLSELDEEHERSCKEYVRRIKAAQEVLNGIKTESMRTFVIMKYIMNVPDIEIRRELNMSRTDFSRARHCVENAERMSEVKWQDRYTLRTS